MYRVSQEIDFCYGHRLLNYSGKCRHLHGHNGKAVVVLETADLDERGMLVDFADIKRTLCTWIDAELDHRMILCDADPAVPFPKVAGGTKLLLIRDNPTAETIARLIFDHAAAQGLPVVEVSLWESTQVLCDFPSGSLRPAHARCVGVRLSVHAPQGASVACAAAASNRMTPENGCAIKALDVSLRLGN